MPWKDKEVNKEYHRLYRLRRQSTERGQMQDKLETNIVRRCRRDGITCDLDLDYVMGLWNDQEGKCYYTGRPMVMNGRRPLKRNACSFDRLDPKLGYIKGNVVLCSYRANAMKQDFTEEEFYEELATILRNRKVTSP